MKSFVALLMLGHPAFAAFESYTPGARSIGMGGVSVALVNNEWAAFANPGVLNSLQQRSISVFFSPQPFGLKELSRGSFSYVEPTSVGRFGLSGSRFGFALYRETALGVSYGNSVSDAFEYGLTLTYYSLIIQNYGTDWTLGVDVGALVHISDQVSSGFAAFNVNAPTIGTANEKLPQVYSTGIAYQPIPEATLGIALVKDIRFPTEFHVGLEYAIFDVVALRGGLTNEPATMNAGVGISYSFVKFDYAFSSHVDLGTTHDLSISLLLGSL